MKKKTVRRIIGWTVLALVAAGLALLPTLVRQTAGQEQASVLTAKAEQGEVEYTLAGGGTLTAEDPVEVKVPDTVEILNYLVENGDRVEAGQALAEADRVTLLGAMSEVQDSLDALSEQMREEGSSGAITTLSAQTAGRVKAIWVQKDDDVRQAMLEHGALMVLSLDGMMVTEIETGLPVPAGTALNLQLSDGKTVTGIVKTVLDGKLTVTLSDDGPKLGDTVTAFTKDGVELGSGTLAVHSAWNVVAVDGIVSYVYVRENQTVYSGSSLLRVEGVAGSAEYQALAAKRGKYEELMADLFSLYTDNIVRAPEAGFVSGIDDSKIKNTAAAENTAQIKLLAATTSDTVSASDDTTPQNTPGSFLGTILANNGDGSFSALVVPASGDSAAIIGLFAGKGTAAPFYSNDPASVPGPGTFVSIQSNETAVVTPADISTVLMGGGTGGMPTGGGMGGFSIPSGMGGMAGMGGLTGAQTEEEEDDGLYETEKKTILSITPDNAMTVTIDVDELDILQYQTGMKADVTVDALADRSFTAEVIEINPIGENSGGNSKYRVKLRLDRAPDMLDGMNASVVVHGSSKTCLLLPAAAVYSQGSKSYVYGALDSKTGKPTLEIPVTTGLSDGEKVEIVSGLTENQPVFYEYYTGTTESEEAV
ncbi:MAG: HlyD family efflux transporter periplasmic adaptor subunit [Oscillospiraceae bacterium]|nr:HlyD family efflux transporter periplasmic adaptor subunit [Oscillospiraceae bacterium]